MTEAAGSNDAKNGSSEINTDRRIYRNTHREAESSQRSCRAGRFGAVGSGIARLGLYRED